MLYLICSHYQGCGHVGAYLAAGQQASSVSAKVALTKLVHANLAKEAQILGEVELNNFLIFVIYWLQYLIELLFLYHLDDWWICKKCWENCSQVWKRVNPRAVCVDTYFRLCNRHYDNGSCSFSCHYRLVLILLMLFYQTPERLIILKIFYFRFSSKQKVSFSSSSRTFGQSLGFWCNFNNYNTITWNYSN